MQEWILRFHKRIRTGPNTAVDMYVLRELPDGDIDVSLGIAVKGETRPAAELILAALKAYKPN